MKIFNYFFVYFLFKTIRYYKRIIKIFYKIKFNKMKIAKLSVCSELTQRENKDLNIKKLNKKENLSAQISRTENSNSNKDIKKNKIYLKLPFQENNSYRNNINKISFEPTLNNLRSKNSFEKIKSIQTNELNNLGVIQQVNLKKIKRSININIQNIDIKNYHYYKYPYSKQDLISESESEIFPLITSTCPNIEIINNNQINNIQYNKIINNNNIINQIYPFQNIKFHNNYFRKKFRRVKLVDLKKIKNKEKNKIKSERIEIKSQDLFSNIIKENNIPITIKEKNNNKENDLKQKIDIIENNKINDEDDSFIDELQDLLINDDEKGFIKIKKEINNNNNTKENNYLINNINNNHINNNKNELCDKFKNEENCVNDLLNKSFDLRDEEDEENEIEKIPQFKNNLIRPPTSYGGILARKKVFKKL